MTVQLINQNLWSIGWGLQELFDENQGRTGFGLLVDANTLEMLDRITAAGEREEIKQKFSVLLSK